MKEYKSVSVPKGAFVFCRYSVALLLWAAIILKIKWLVVAVFVILALSALLRVGRAPMIVLYRFTLGLIFKDGEEILDEKAMQFAHTMGAFMTMVALVSLFFINETIGWWLVFLLAILKSISAFGFCPAYKLYGCMSAGGCCALSKKVSKK